MGVPARKSCLNLWSSDSNGINYYPTAVIFASAKVRRDKSKRRITKKYKRNDLSEVDLEYEVKDPYPDIKN